MHIITQLTKRFVNESSTLKKLSKDEKFELRLELSILLIDFEAQLKKEIFNNKN